MYTAHTITAQLTIEPAIGYQTTGHNWLSSYANERSAIATGTAAEKLGRAKLINIPGRDVAPVVLIVVPHAIVDVPWRAEGLGNGDIDGAVTVWSCPPLIVCYARDVCEIVFTSSESVWTVVGFAVGVGEFILSQLKVCVCVREREREERA